MNYKELIIGAIIGWLVTRIASFFTRAQLSFEIDNGQIFKQEDKKYRFLSIRVINKPKHFIYRLLNVVFGRVNLDNAKAQVIFIAPTNPNITIKTIHNARWATTKEPVDYSSGELDYAQILMPSRDSIFPEENGVINIAIKRDGDDSFYGFNNQSYDKDHWPLYPDFEIKERYCLVKIEILASGRRYYYQSSIINTNKKIENFCLKDL